MEPGFNREVRAFIGEVVKEGVVIVALDVVDGLSRAKEAFRKNEI
jgi:hypothetical protein